ncbi:MAG TPA: AMP-binding protein [Pseudonocardiaceae bacterium]
MGRRAFTRFLTPPAEPPNPTAGVHRGAEFRSWDDLLRQGRDRAALVREQRAYVVDPDAGMEAIVSLFAVATVADTVLLWVSPAPLGVPHREIAPGLYEVDSPVPGPVGRPLWGVATSGSSGAPKVAIGYADAWELVALHYERAMFRPAFGGRTPAMLATCLPLQFSAAFFMTVLPALFLRRDLLLFEPHDWSPVRRAAAGSDVLVLAVPALAAAACLGTAEPVDLGRAVLFLGGGHVSADRVALIRDRFTGAGVVNLYGTAETGALTVDPDPGHNQHVGRPIPGKPVWLEGADEHGVGAVATAGPDCCRYVWQPGERLVSHGDHVAGTDYGRFDADGRLCLEGRVDGGEKVGGVLVYPRTIERRLLALDGVSDARVLVRRGPSGLEHLAARVVGRVDEATVRAHCAALPEASRPGRVECIPELDAVSAYSRNGKL